MTIEEALQLNGVVHLTAWDGDVREAPRALRWVWPRHVLAITTPHTIWVSPYAMHDVRTGQAATLLIHELAHVEQWRTLGRVRFLATYLSDYLLARAAGFPHETAYRAIRLERAAVAVAERSA